MKKFLFILFLFFVIIIQPVMAKNVKVQAMSDFSTENPPETWELKIIDGFTTKNGTEIYSGSIIKGRIENIINPKRLKRDANFNFIPFEYYDSLTKRTHNIDKNFVGKYSTLTDVTPTAVVEKGAVMAGSHFISGLISPGVALIKGIVKNDEGNRAKSAAISVYDSTPISYVKKGKQLEIKEGQIFVINFKTIDDTDDQNESYDSQE